MQKRQQADEEYESSNAKRKAIQQELQTTTEKLTEAEENETEVYKETGAAADEIGDIVQQGIDIEDGKISITEAATTATQTNTTSEASNATAKGANANATSSETIANTANSTSKTANTAATNVNTTSENLNTGAKERNSLVTSILSVGTKGLALAQNVLTWATNAVTVSMRELWAAMLANPLTTIITLVTTAMSVFAMFGSEEEDAAKKTQDMGNKAAEASNKVRSLFAVLNNGKAEDHKDAINELKSAYEEYGIKLDETKMKSQSMSEQADELKAHEEELIGIIEKRSLEMERANQLQEAYNNYNSSNDSSFGSFKDSIDDKLSDVEMGTIRSLISQDDIDKLAELRKEMNACGGDLKVYNALNAQYSQLQGELNVKIGTYLENMHHSRSEVAQMIPDINDFTDGLVSNKVELDGTVDSINNSVNAAERARKATSNLTYAQEEQALKSQYAKKSFKDLNSEIQETIKLCSRKLHLDIKVNYDDSELPAWIKNMSQSQLKASMAVRKNWLDGHKKGDVLQVGGQYKTYEQVANELAMMQARGNNFESKPKKSQKEIDKERKAREKAARDAEKARNDAETKAGNKRKAEEDYSKSISSYSEKAIQDMTKNRINAMNEGYSKELAQITENADKERKAVEEGIDKLVEARKKRDQAVWVNSGKGRKANMWKQSKTDEEYKNEVLNETMKDSKGNPVKVNGMEMTIGMSVANQMNAIRDKAVKQNEDVLAKEAQSMYDYLKTYGTFQEQKLAIAADYAKRISEVENSTDSDSSKQWKIKSLKEEQKKETDSVEASAIMQKIDWYQVFGNVGGIMKDALVPLLADLDKFVGTDKFQNLGADQQKSIVDAMQNIRNSIGNTSDLGWKDLARDVVAYQDALKNAKIAQEEYTETETKLIPRIKDLQNQIANAKKSGNVAEQTRLQEDLNKVQGQLAESGKKIVTANTKVRTSGQKLAQTTQNVTQPISAIHEFLSNSGLSDLEALWDSFDQLKGGIDGLKALSEAKKAADGLKDMGKEAADAAADAGKALSEGLSQAGFIGQIVSAILKILDVLKDGIGTLISNLLDTVFNAISGILKNILSGDFITQIGGSLVSGIGNILNTISFGGFNSLFGVGGNAKEVNRTIDKLTDRNEILTDAIDKLRDSIDKNSGIKAVEDAQKAENLQKEKEQNLKSIMEAQMGYHGSHHSFNAYFRGFSQEQIKKVSDAIGRQWNGNLNDLQSADEAAAILQNPDVVEAIKNTGKGGYGDRVLEKLKDYAAEAGTLDDIADDLAESLTQISFDSLKSEFIDTLMDMNSSAQDFSDNFSKMLMQAVLKAKVDDLLGNDMQAFYDEWTERAKANGGKLSKTDITALKEKYDEMVQEGLKIRDEVAEITGYKQSYEQSASSGSFESMSQDTGDELNGRFTAVQIATEGTYEETKLINTKLDAIAARDGGTEGSLLTASVNTIMGNVGNIWLAVDEGRTILAQSLMYLQSIDERQERWHKPMLQAFNDIHELKDKMSRF